MMQQHCASLWRIAGNRVAYLRFQLAIQFLDMLGMLLYQICLSTRIPVYPYYSLSWFQYKVKFRAGLLTKWRRLMSPVHFFYFLQNTNEDFIQCVLCIIQPISDDGYCADDLFGSSLNLNRLVVWRLMKLFSFIVMNFPMVAILDSHIALTVFLQKVGVSPLTVFLVCDI